MGGSVSKNSDDKRPELLLSPQPSARGGVGGVHVVGGPAGGGGGPPPAGPPLPAPLPASLASPSPSALDPLYAYEHKSTVPTVFRWEHGGGNVFITGDFNGWSRRVPMHRSGNDFVYIASLPPGRHAYKFIVDDDWRFAPDQATVADAAGNINNIIDLTTFSAESDAAHGGGPPVPQSRRDSLPGAAYGHGVPDEDEYTKEPPLLPPQLRQIILNAPLPDGAAAASGVGTGPGGVVVTPGVDPAVVLPPPQHVTLNHLYCTAIKDGLMVQACSQRYRRKYVTTVLYTLMPTGGGWGVGLGAAPPVTALAAGGGGSGGGPPQHAHSASVPGYTLLPAPAAATGAAPAGGAGGGGGAPYQRPGAAAVAPRAAASGPVLAHVEAEALTPTGDAGARARPSVPAELTLRSRAEPAVEAEPPQPGRRELAAPPAASPAASRPPPPPPPAPPAAVPSSAARAIAALGIDPSSLAMLNLDGDDADASSGSGSDSVDSDSDGRGCGRAACASPRASRHRRRARTAGAADGVCGAIDGAAASAWRSRAVSGDDGLLGGTAALSSDEDGSGGGVGGLWGAARRVRAWPSAAGGGGAGSSRQPWQRRPIAPQLCDDAGRGSGASAAAHIVCGSFSPLAPLAASPLLAPSCGTVLAGKLAATAPAAMGDLRPGGGSAASSAATLDAPRADDADGVVGSSPPPAPQQLMPHPPQRRPVLSLS